MSKRNIKDVGLDRQFDDCEIVIVGDDGYWLYDLNGTSERYENRMVRCGDAVIAISQSKNLSWTTILLPDFGIALIGTYHLMSLETFSLLSAKF